MKTLLISKHDVQRVLTPRLAIESVYRAFKAHGLGQAQMPPKSYLNFKKGDLRSMPAFVHGQGFHVAGVKCVNVHPGNRRLGLPTVMGVIVLTSPGNGFPLAVLDGTYLIGMRTGAAGALAAKLLSRKNAETAGFVGCGAQAQMQLTCLREVRNITSVKVWQRSARRRSAARFCEWARDAFGVEASVSSSVDEVTAGADIVVTTTPSERPLVGEVSPGTHINAFGADAPGKQEIDGRILKRAKLIVDDRTQASHSGEINVPLARRQIFKKDIHGELGEIAAGRKAGRESEEEITLFDSTGLAIQDICCAAAVYEQIAAGEEVREIDLF